MLLQASLPEYTPWPVKRPRAAEGMWNLSAFVAAVLLYHALEVVLACLYNPQDVGWNSAAPSRHEALLASECALILAKCVIDRHRRGTKIAIAVLSSSARLSTAC